MSGFAYEVTLHWVAVAAYVGATVLFTSAMLFGKPQAHWGTIVAAAGLAPHGVALVHRWIAAGHGPYMLRYEVLSSNAWVAIAATLVFLARRRSWTAVGVVVVPVAVLMIAVGIFSDSELRELPPTLRSVWLVFHVTFAKISAGAWLLSVATATFVLLAGREHRAPWMRRLPSRDSLDANTVRFMGFGFIFWTVAVAAGAIWAKQSWGRYWSWDPIETWSLVTWLLYGTALHARVFFRLRPGATAYVALGAFAIFVLTALVLPFLVPSLHSAYFQ